MNLEEERKRLVEELANYIMIYGMTHKKTIKKSEELDKIIAKLQK